jgi:hypothetical protein
MKKNENFIGDNAYLAPNMEMIEVETENSFASTNTEQGKTDYAPQPVVEDFSDLLDF